MATEAGDGEPYGGAVQDRSDNPWLFSEDEVLETPSRVTGVSRDTELRILARTASFLQDCARELLIPQLTISVALKFFQRFYMLESMLTHQPPKVAAACLFLACKVQETHKRLKDIIFWTVKIRTRNTKDFPDGQDVYEDSPGYYDEKSSILDKEREVLRVLNFDLTVDHPYKHLWTLNKCFLPPQTATDAERDGDKGATAGANRRAVAQSAWNLINDSFRTYIHMRYDPREIATAAFFLAAKLHKVSLPDGTERCPKTGKRLLAWHEYFNTETRHIELICNEMLDLYETPQESGDDESAE
jgi:cyclin T